LKVRSPAQAVLAFTAIFAIGVTATHPDARIAERNVDRYTETGRLDQSYDGSLSADATPALVGLPVELRDKVLGDQAERLAEDDGFWGANLSRNRARAVLAD